MTKKEILKKLQTEFIEAEKLLNELSENQLFKKTMKKNWTIAENIQHLVLATKPLVELFGNPEIMATNWGKSTSSSRKYNDVVALYLKHIGIPGFTTKHYMPSNMEFTKLELIQNFQSTNESLIDKTSLLSEEDLDNYRIPHPLIGLMTCKEFLYFTHYHTVHHLKTIRKTLKNN